MTLPQILDSHIVPSHPAKQRHSCPDEEHLPFPLQKFKCLHGSSGTGVVAVIGAGDVNVKVVPVEVVLSELGGGVVAFPGGSVEKFVEGAGLELEDVGAGVVLLDEVGAALVDADVVRGEVLLVVTMNAVVPVVINGVVVLDVIDGGQCPGHQCPTGHFEPGAGLADPGAQ